jgi:hypothetical protein
MPSVSSIYRCLKRHSLIELGRRKKSRNEFRRWERDYPMQPWQLDLFRGVMLDDGTDLMGVTASMTTADGPGFLMGIDQGVRLLKASADRHA